MDTITFDYTNHKGETRTRTVIPDSIDFLFNPGYGYQPGWFLSGWDMDKNARRSFRLSNINISGERTVFSLRLEAQK